MENVMKLINVASIIRILLWGMFVAGLVFNIWKGVTSLNAILTIGILLLAIDFPKKENRSL